jgi:protein disulfide-isomerase
MRLLRLISKTLLLTIFSLGYTTFAVAAPDPTWHSDIDEARQLAAEQDRHLLLDFTGSDWCPWCKKLDAEVFSTEEFAEFAAEKLILVKIDFPKTRQLSAEQTQANRSLAQEYAVRGFPTVVMLNSKGERIGTTGYRRGSVDSYIEHLRGMMVE